jgi:uncharacterized protein (DUF736 family)
MFRQETAVDFLPSSAIAVGKQLPQMEIAMIIGTFTYDDGRDIYSGKLYLTVLPAAVTIEPTERRSQRAPDYRVLAAAGREIGAGWKRTSRDKGTPFVSIHIDDPACPRRSRRCCPQQAS